MLRDGIESSSVLDSASTIADELVTARDAHTSASVSSISNRASKPRPNADAFRELERHPGVAKSAVGAFIAAGQENLGQFIRGIFGASQKKEDKPAA